MELFIHLLEHSLEGAITNAAILTEVKEVFKKTTS